MTKHVCVTLCLLGQVFALSARAETLGGVEISPAEKRACAPDVIRLCRNFMPDQTAVFGCIKTNELCSVMLAIRSPGLAGCNREAFYSCPPGLSHFRAPAKTASGFA